MPDKKIGCIACGVFRKELEALSDRGLIDFDSSILESMLHMKPENLETAMNKVISKNPTDKLLILYGDCQPHMNEIQKRKNIAKTDGINCCQILLGKEVYRKFQREKAFIFLPEWVLRWKEIFTIELGFQKPENARTFMKEYINILIYVDTGVVPVPSRTLEEIADFFDLPYEIFPVSLDFLRQAIDDAVKKLNSGGST